MTSPGQATLARAQLEASLRAVARREYRKFLAHGDWVLWVEKMLAAVQRRLNLDELVLGQLRHRLAASNLPEAVAIGAELAGYLDVDRMVRTEATSVFGAERLNELAGEGHRSKRWVSHHDAKTRPSHAAADGQTVPLTSAFTVGGYALMYPGDGSAPPQERENCRCVVVGVKRRSR